MNHTRQRNLFLGILINSILFLSSPTYTLAYDQPVEDGIDWLATNQNPDGSWGIDTTRETATVIEVLNELGETGAEYNDGVTFLEGVSPEIIDYLSRKVIALSESGSDISADVDQLIGLKNDDGGFGFEEPYPSSLIDTLLAAKALKKAGIEDHEIIGALLYYLTENQNSDGSFGYAEGGDGSLEVTSLAIIVLSGFQPQYNLSSYTANALSYILTFKQGDNGFGESGSSVIETALAVRAMIAEGSHVDDVLLGRSYLISVQQENGSWEDEAYSTALALWALKETEDIDKPNLRVLNSSITISLPYPVEGQTVTVGCTVMNTGTIAAADVAVNFYLGDPASAGELIGSNLIPLVESSGSAYTEITWVVDEVGDNDIYVFADPDNVIDEVSEEDNIAFTSITAASKPDLVIAGSDISFDNTSPLAGEYFTLTANIHNLGEGAIGHVTVAVYDGDPQASGAKLTGDGVGPS